jgi:hypothetical protein
MLEIELGGQGHLITASTRRSPVPVRAEGKTGEGQGALGCLGGGRHRGEVSAPMVDDTARLAPEVEIAIEHDQIVELEPSSRHESA